MKLSIITINFNNLEGLKKTAESVINQTWKEFEWIIIDGGSTDGSKEFIVSLNDDLNRNGWNPIAYWCSEPDKGIYNAMNKGIGKAKGEYLNFMNSGDCYYENSILEKVINYPKLFQADVYIGNTVNINNGIETRINDVSNENLDMFHFINSGIPHQATFYNKKMFDVFGLFDENLKIVSDWKHAILMLYFGKTKMKYIPYNICINQDGGISSNPAANKERYEVLDTLFHPVIREEMLKLHYYKEEIEYINNYKLSRMMYVFSHKLSTLMKRLGL